MKTPLQILGEHEDGYDRAAVDLAAEWLEDWDGWEYGKSPRLGAAAALYYAQHAAGVPVGERANKDEVAADFGVGEASMTRLRKTFLGEEPTRGNWGPR